MPTPARKRSQTHRKALRKRMQIYRNRAKPVQTVSQNSLTKSLPADFALGDLTSKQIYSMDGNSKDYRSYFWQDSGSSMLIDTLRKGADQNAIRAEMVADLERVREKQDVLKEGEILPSEILINTTNNPNDQEDAAEFVREMVEDVNDLHDRNITVTDIQVMKNGNGTTMRIKLAEGEREVATSNLTKARDILDNTENLQIIPRNNTLPKLQPGKPAPSIQNLTEGRIGSILSDALNRETKSQRALRLFKNAQARIPIPDGSDPLTVRFNTDDLIINMALDLKPDALKLPPDRLKRALVENVMEMFKLEGRPNADTKVNVAARVDHFLNPHFNDLRQNLTPRGEVNDNAYQLLLAANPRPVKPAAGAPPLTDAQKLIDSFHEVSLTKMTVSTRNRLIAADRLDPGEKIALKLEVFKKEVVKNYLYANLPFGPLDPGVEDEAIVAGVRDRVDQLFDQYISASEAGIFSDSSRIPDAEIRALMNQASQNNPTNEDLIKVAARRFLAQDSARRPNLVAPNDGQKQLLTQALEAMPIVRAMYSGDFSNIDAQDGLAANLNVLPATQAQAHFQRVQFHLEGTVRKALLTFQALVEVNRRPPVERITNIEVNPDKNGRIFRADANRQNDRVRISAVGDVSTVVHELGHQTEFVQSMAQWRDIRSLLEFRSPNGNLVDIYNNGKELAMSAPMPAFGPYSAKVYLGGDTEVMSMAMEYFSDPQKARKLIKRDPVVAAMILRAIRPNDFQSYVNNNDQNRPAALQALQGEANWQRWLPRGANGFN